jgi:dihydroorotase-like cyclic amidohydrolase
MEQIMLRPVFVAILLLTGCEEKQVKQQVGIGQDPQIESPLQNTMEGMAKAKVEGPTVKPGAVDAVSHAGMPGASAASAVK